MDRFIVNYVEKMNSYSDAISKTIESANEYWSPDKPPVIMLLSQIGKTLVRGFPELSHTEKESICKHIESGMISTNDQLATAVATGLIEAIVTSTDDDQFLWVEIEKSLGEKSKEHALAWKNFGQ